MEDMVQYVCTECRFRFKRRISWNDTMCPNCGRERSFERADLTITKMIKDAEDLAD